MKPGAVPTLVLSVYIHHCAQEGQGFPEPCNILDILE